MKKVFVYGSLLSDLGNHGLLKTGKANFVGITRSPKGFDMLDLGYFPGIIKTESENDVIGEVYEVNEPTMMKLDRLEGYNENSPHTGLYDKMSINTEFGEAFVYIYNNHYSRSSSIVENGDWRTYYNKKIAR